MKCQFSVICLALSLLVLRCFAADPELTPLQARAMEIRAMGDKNRGIAISALSHAERAEMASYLKQRAQIAYTPEVYDRTLVQLGDDETIKKQVELLIHGDEREAVGAIAQLDSYSDPSVIEAIAPAMFIDQPGRPGALSDRGGYTGDTVFALLKKTRGFHSDVYNWANRAAGMNVPYFTNQVLREWWKANEVHFKNRDYMAVQPGALPPSLDDTVMIPYQAPDGSYHVRLKPGVEWSPKPPPPNPRTLEPEPVPSSAPPAAGAPAPPAPASVESAGSFPWIAVTAAACALALLAFLLRPRKPASRD